MAENLQGKRDQVFRQNQGFPKPINMQQNRVEQNQQMGAARYQQQEPTNFDKNQSEQVNQLSAKFQNLNPFQTEINTNPHQNQRYQQPNQFSQLSQGFSNFKNGFQQQTDVETYRKQMDNVQDPQHVIQMQADRMNQMVNQRVKEEGPHSIDFWSKDPNHLHILQNVLFEPADDSEDQGGNRKYKPEKDQDRQKLKAELTEWRQNFIQKREQIIKENKERQKRGEPLLKVPKDRDFDNDNETIRLETLIQGRKDKWVYEQKMKKQNEFGIKPKQSGQGVYNDDSNSNSSGMEMQAKPSVVNQLNVAVNNVVLTPDVRYEMAILGQRERRRFNQVRRLGIKVPLNYVRISLITSLPKEIQDELVKYPSAIEDDSDFEDDEQVIKKYKNDPMRYINFNSQRKREQLEAGGEPYRIYQAREKAGDFRYKDILEVIKYKANDEFLSDHGLVKGMTREKMDGTYKRQAILSNQAYCQDKRAEYVIEVTKRFYDQYGQQMFSKNPKFRDRLLDLIGGKMIMLKAYPEMIRAMYTKVDQNGRKSINIRDIPEALRMEEVVSQRISPINQDQNMSRTARKSVVVQEYENHLSNRQSLARSLIQDLNDVSLDAHSDDQSRVQDFSGKEDMIQILSSAKKPLSEQASNKQPGQHNQDNLDILSSSSSGQTRQYYQQKIQDIKKQNQLEAEKEIFLKQQQKQEFNLLEKNLEFMVLNARDLGKEVLDKYSQTVHKRRLSRREMTDQLLWHTLELSAEFSDESINHVGFTHPLLIAKKNLQLQKIVPVKQHKTHYRDRDRLNINGQEYRWKDFVSNFYDKIQTDAKETGLQVNYKEFLLNQGDPIKEKKLLWTINNGFESENDEDEQTNYDRAERQYICQIKEKHGNKPFLRTRPIKQFEILILKFGGAQLLKQLTGKRFEIEDIEYIQEWVDPVKLEDPQFGIFNQSFGDFILQTTKESFTQIYDQERSMQMKVMNDDQDKVKRTIFSNEIMQLYQLLKKATHDGSLEIREQLNQVLPKSMREYIEEINFQNFKTPPESPVPQPLQSSKPIQKKREISAFESDESVKDEMEEEEEKKSDQQQIEDQDYQSDFGGGNADYFDEEDNFGVVGSVVEDKNPDILGISHIPKNEEDYVGGHDNFQETPLRSPKSPDHLLKSGESIKKRTDSKQRDQKATISFDHLKPRVIQLEQPRFIIPDSKGPDYETLQKRLYEFDNALEVDDSEEITQIINEQKLLDPYMIEQKLLPKLDELVQQSNGRLRGFFIWPHHRVDSQELLYPNGRRYPKRLKLYRSQPEDTPIIVKGIEIGYMISNVPYLHPDAWKGQGLPLQNQNVIQNSPYKPTGVQSKQPAARRVQQPPVRGNRGQIIERSQNRQRQGQGNKKRKADEALKLGAGMNDLHKDDVMFKIEQALPFMKYRDDENQRQFELIEIDRSQDNGRKVRIVVALYPRQQLTIDDPNSKSVLIKNVDKVKAKLRIKYRQSNSGQQQRQEAYINDLLKLAAKSIWTLENTSSDQNIIVSFELQFNQ